ncbi:hypothetical protein HDU76_003555, partial [Blyttiomyces sp. JEL0837]
IFNADGIPRLCYGTIVDFKEMIVEAAHLCAAKASDAEAFNALVRKREELLAAKTSLRLYAPGPIYHLYSTVWKMNKRETDMLNASAASLDVMSSPHTDGYETEDGITSAETTPASYQAPITAPSSPIEQILPTHPSAAKTAKSVPTGTPGQRRKIFRVGRRQSVSRQAGMAPVAATATTNTSTSPSSSTRPPLHPSSTAQEKTKSEKKSARTTAHISLPASEHPEIPHIVVEVSRPEHFHFVSLRRNYFLNHMPWEYDKAFRHGQEWMEKLLAEQEQKKVKDVGAGKVGTLEPVAGSPAKPADNALDGGKGGGVASTYTDVTRMNVDEMAPNPKPLSPGSGSDPNPATVAPSSLPSPLVTNIERRKSITHSVSSGSKKRWRIRFRLRRDRADARTGSSSKVGTTDAAGGDGSGDEAGSNDDQVQG